MAYKLVEITHEEHLALADAGVWVQWGVGRGGEWSDETYILASGSGCKKGSLSPWLTYKFYTRVEVNDDELQ